MKKLLYPLFIFMAQLCILSPMPAEIRPISTIEAVLPEMTDDTLVLFNIAEVLMDTETSLGTSAWRRYVRKKVTSRQHDLLTLLVFQKVAPKPPEPVLPALIKSLQVRGLTVFAFTSRGRHEWYSSQIQDVDLITEALLNQIDIDFTRTKLPATLAQLPEIMHDHFHAGILYATNTMDKGEMLTQLLKKTGYRPAKVVFIDDKIEGLESVQEAMKTLGIPFVGFAYNRTALDHKNYDPMIANIQLENLLFRNKVLSDDEAAQIKATEHLDVNPDDYFFKIIKSYDFKDVLN